MDNGEAYDQWMAWFDGAEPLLKSIPLAPMTGSQEYISLDAHKQAAHMFNHLFAWPNQQSDIVRAPFYSFDYGDIHFVVLDTQFEALPTTQQSLVKEGQAQWLKEDLHSTKKKWKVVFMHHDSLAYTSEALGQVSENFSSVGRLFMPIFEEGEVDLVLSGHLETYRRRGHIKEFKRSETGPYYIVSGKAGDWQGGESWGPHRLDEYVLPNNKEPNYLVVTEQGNTLLISAYFMNGTQFDAVRLNKASNVNQ